MKKIEVITDQHIFGKYEGVELKRGRTSIVDNAPHTSNSLLANVRMSKARQARRQKSGDLKREADIYRLLYQLSVYNDKVIRDETKIRTQGQKKM